MATFVFFAASFAAIGVTQASPAVLPPSSTPTLLPPLPGGSDGGVLWTNQNTFGAGTMSTPGDVPTTTTTFNPSSFGSNLTVTVGVEPGYLEFSDGTDRLVLKENYLGGYTVTRTKTGYSGIQKGVYNSQGNLVQSQETLSVPASAAFSDGLASMQDFIDASGGTGSYIWRGDGNSAETVGGVINVIQAGCRDALIWDGLAMVGTGIGIGMTWLSGPWFGIPGTIAGTAILHNRAQHVTQSCMPPTPPPPPK